MRKRVLLIGANSDIAQACGTQFLAQGCSVVWAAHKPDELPELAKERVYVDLEDTAASKAILLAIECDIVVYCAGKLGENESTLFTSAGSAVRTVNYETPVVLFGMFAERFAAKKTGVLVGISSVAADRGKSSNVIYGSSKAGFDHFLSGLRQYLHDTGVRVITIRPGYVATKMTEGMQLPGWLTASKEQVARKIVRLSLHGSRNIVYVKAIWRPLTWILKHIPERIFKRKKL